MINSLSEFYKVIDNSVKLKQKIMNRYVRNKNIHEKLILSIEDIYKEVSSIRQDKNKKYLLRLDDGSTIKLDLAYELEELRKDIIFLRQGEDELIKHMRKKNKNFDKDFKGLIDNLSGNSFENFITDRDGTINNYCGLYLSSVQSIYNAVFLYRFVKNKVSKFIIMTSAPLEGIKSLSLFPRGSVVYAGSKGREYFNKLNLKKGMKIAPDKKRVLKLITKEIKDLLSKVENKKFSLIGSGFQQKYGQITIARQDISNSISILESSRFLKDIEDVVRRVDPDKQNSHIEDTGKDVEIILTNDKGASDGFSKGDGVDFLAKELSLNIETGLNLVAGDTSSDIPMAKKCLESNNSTIPVFITQDSKLKKKIKSTLGKSLYVSSPDIFVAALNEISKMN